MPIYITLFVFTFLIASLSLIISKHLSQRFSIFKNENNVSLLGGIGLALAFYSGILFYYRAHNTNFDSQLVYIFAFALAILLLEVFDDWREFSLLKKIIFQIVIIGLFLFVGKRIQIYFLPPWVNYLISFLWIMGITNAFNLLDIKDGLCSGMSCIITLTFALISLLCKNHILAGVFFMLSGTLLSFYLFNFPPATIYMGNSGSHFIGFLIATLSIYLDYAGLDNVGALFAPIILLALPIIDTFFLIFARSKKKMLPLRKSNDHIFLRLLKRNVSYGKALGLMYLLTFLWCTTGIFLTIKNSSIFILLFVTASLFTFITMAIITSWGKKFRTLFFHHKA
jgi:UDP-GlcNAc:undecaprenyl-phosphate GlcNAc-1-phosphate transferase